jgi:Base plate wedge protein 53
MLKEFMFSKEVDTSKLKSVPVATSRYDAKVILSTAEGDYTRVLRLNEIKSTLSDTDGYMNVDLVHQYDPYKIAYEVYGNASLYWVILAANDLFDMFDLVEGLTIRIPNILKVLGYNGLVVTGDEF